MTKQLIAVISAFIISTQLFAATSGSEFLRIHGSNTIGAKLAPALVYGWLKSDGFQVKKDEFTAKEERLIVAKKGNLTRTIEIHAHGSSTSFRDFASGKTDVGMASRRIKAKEIRNLATLGKMDSKDSEYVIALDGLPVIVNKKNPLVKLDIRTIKNIFTGKISNWSQLGLPAAPIHVYARDNNSGTYDTFKSLVLGKKTPLVKTAKRFESNSRLSAAVAKDINGIGFTGLAYIAKSKPLSIYDEGTRALKPNEFTVATEDYLLARRLYMYLPEKNLHPLAKAFVHYAISQQADSIVSENGFVSQQINAYRVRIPAEAPREYRQFTMGAVRLSINIRFDSGSVKLDNKARQDVDRLVAYLQQPENSSRKILLFGFADRHEVIPFMSSSFSVQRADVVANYLSKHGIHPIRVRGYGHALPVASNATEKGRYKNRRVEIWMM